MEDDRLNWPQTSLTSSNPLPSLNNDEDLLDFELESEMCLRSPPNHKYLIDTSAHRTHNKSPAELMSTVSGDKDYSFFASDEVVSGVSVNVAFFPDASRSAGESSSNEEDVVAVETSADDGSRGERKSRKNRKKKK